MAKPAQAKKPSSSKPLSKSAILEAVTTSLGDEISRKHVKLVVETLVTVGHRELKKSGVFVLPGFAKFVVVKKPARPAREGINPFTKEKQKFAAKPASKGVRARPVKAIKDALGLDWFVDNAAGRDARESFRPVRRVQRGDLREGFSPNRRPNGEVERVARRLRHRADALRRRPARRRNSSVDCRRATA